MKSFSIATILVAVVSTVNAIIVNTPVSVVACQPLLITWDPQGSAGPFFLSVVPGNNPSGPALFSWTGLTGTSYSWTVTEPAGTSLGLLLRDQTGAISQSAPFTVQPGSTTCLNSTSSISTPPGSSTSPLLPTTSPSNSTTTSSLPKTTTSTSTPITTTTKPPTLATSTPPTRPSTTSSPSPTTTGGNSSGNIGAAFTNTVNFVSAGLLAALVGAVLA